MQSRFNELTAQLARLNRGLAATSSEPANPGFEPEVRSDLTGTRPAPDAPQHVDRARRRPPAAAAARSGLPGWRIEAKTAGSSTIAIDRENTREGRGSLKLTAPLAPVSVVSDAFVPDSRSSLDIQFFLRSSAAGSRVRVWIEGEAAGKPYVRRTELEVSTVWEARIVRASDIPAGGLESARLRFELVSPGVLWIDDLHVQGDTASKSTRLNAQRTLLAALQAYREQRYADFARLAESHWIRQSSSPVSGRLARTNDASDEGGGRTKR